MDVFPPGWILQEDAPIPAVEDTLLAGLHSGHPLKSVSTDNSSFHIYICQRHYSSEFGAWLEQLLLTPCLKLDEQAAL